MVRGWLKIIAVLSLGFMMPILLIRAQPYNDDGLRRFLNAGDDCVPPCLMNVLPGTTPLYKAHLDLLAHEWIASVESNEYALLGEPTSIRWAWNGQQPAFFRPTGRGSVFSRDGIIVDEVQVEAGLPLGGWWLALGPPDTYRLTTIGGTIHFPGEYLAFINMGAIKICQRKGRQKATEVVRESLRTNPTTAEAQDGVYQLFGRKPAQTSGRPQCRL